MFLHTIGGTTPAPSTHDPSQTARPIGTRVAQGVRVGKRLHLPWRKAQIRRKPLQCTDAMSLTISTPLVRCNIGRIHY